MIKDIILEEIKSAEEDISVVIKDLTSDKWILRYDEENIYPSASIIKIPIMVEAFYQIEQGRFSLDEKIRINPKDKVSYSIVSELNIVDYPLIDLIHLMIVVSDNTATNVLIDLLGFDKINERLKELNCTNSILRRKMMDFEAAKEGKENLISPMDMALLMEKIYKQSIINPRACKMMIDILTRQKYRDMLPRYILDEIVIAHKTGNLTGLNHDIGIFYLENIHYILGVFTNNGENDLQGKRTIGRISKLVYESLLQVSGIIK